MKFGNETRGLWLRTRYREGQFEGEAALLVYDDESFSDLMVSGDIKEVFERRASTANIFVAVPFVINQQCREALKVGSAVQRAASYLSGKSGNIYLIELHKHEDSDALDAKACSLHWDATTQETKFGEPVSIESSLREGWLFYLFDSTEGLVVAPAGVHFRKSSHKHTTTFLRAANALTSSAGCGILAFFALSQLGRRIPKRVFVDTAPLLSLAFALMRVARSHGIWQDDVPARSFSSYGGLKQVGRLSASDIILVSASTSGSLAQELIKQGARRESLATFYFLGTKGAPRPEGVLCDLTAAANRTYGYQAVVNYPANDCKLCKSEYLLAELEGDQFLLQERQHRLLRVLKKTQSGEARIVLTELCKSDALKVVLRTDTDLKNPVIVDENQLLLSPSIRSDFVRLMRRYCPQPLALVVRVNIAEHQIRSLVIEAGVKATFDAATIIDWPELPSQKRLHKGAAVLVIFGSLSSHTQARSVNASLRGVIDEGNVAYLSALTLASSPEQYQDLKMFLGYGERGLETFTYRDARRLALPGGFGQTNSWEAELDLLNLLATSHGSDDLENRRNALASTATARGDIFLSGKNGPLAIQRDFVYLDTRDGTEGISQADVFAVVLNLLCASRSTDRELATKAASPSDLVELTQSVYGHVLISPVTFLNYNDAVLKASVLRAARPSELMYEVDESHSTHMAEIIQAELSAWDAGTGEALPEMLLAIATQRLRVREIERLTIRRKAIAAGLPPLLAALAQAIPS
ncbi:MAG: hypothetical protein WAW73_18995 [Rhodoferax sp.]